MDELEIAGQRYLSTRRAGKEHKYHSDYIGQLIRGGKVVGQKVGRSWYVQEASLSAYLNGEGAEGKAAAKKEATTPVVKVEPVMNKEEAKEATPIVEEKKVTEVFVQEEKVSAPQEVAVDAAPVKIFREVPVANPAPVRRVPVDDTNRIHINTTKATSIKSNTLRYIADDAPVLPTAPTKKVSVTVSEEVPTYESEQYLPSVEEVQTQSRVGALSLVALAVIGILTFSITAGASVAISSHTVVEEGQVAGVGYTLK